MQLFRSEDHVQRWLDRRGYERGQLLGLGQLWGLADAWYRDKLLPDWRRHSLEEAEDIFQSLGLTGQFWRLRPAP
jgi:hypothetical protein